MAGELSRISPTTLYRLDQLEKKQAESFEGIQEKLDKLVDTVNALRTEQKIHKTETELGINNTVERIAKLEVKLEGLQKELANQIVASSTEIASIRTSMTVTEKLGPGAAAGGTAGLLVMFVAELITKLMGGA